MAAKRANGRQTPIDKLIEESVQRALATWLSGQAIRATEALTADIWADEQFRQDFLATAREVAHETLQRLRRPR
jgi:hypothetical protein